MGLTVSRAVVTAPGLSGVQISDQVDEDMTALLAAVDDAATESVALPPAFHAELDSTEERDNVQKQMRKWCAMQGVRFRQVKGSETDTGFDFRIEREENRAARLTATAEAREAGKGKPRGRK